MIEQNRKAPAQTDRDEVPCHLVQLWLPGYLHGELTAIQRRQIQAHLAQCNHCAQQVQEARLLTNDLQAEADRYQPRLTRDASLRIQSNVYRRMQRSLVWQRTGQIIRLSMAVTTLLVLLAGSFLFGRFWLPFLANPAVDSPAGEATTLPGEAQLVPTAAPTPAPAIPAPQPAENVIDTVGNGRRNASDHWTAAAPGQPPEQLAATIMAAALARDAATLNNLFVGMGAVQMPTANLWLQIGNRCQQSPSAADFTFIQRPIPLRHLASVSIWYENHLVGEIKMRQVQGEWFATFTRTPAVNPCLAQ